MSTFSTPASLVYSVSSYSAPAAPGYSDPATPAYSAPAYSAPAASAYSAPAAPAYSAPAAPAFLTIDVLVYSTPEAQSYPRKEDSVFKVHDFKERKKSKLGGEMSNRLKL